MTAQWKNAPLKFCSPLCCRCCSRVQPWPGPVKHTAASLPGSIGATRRVGDAMGLIAPILMGIVLFYWLSFMGTIWCWLRTISCLLQGKFIRAAIWFSLGLGGLWWWMGTEGVDFDKWLHASYGIVSLGALATFARFYNRHRQAVQTVTPSPVVEPAPVININININIDPHTDHRTVHADLAANSLLWLYAISASRGSECNSIT